MQTALFFLYLSSLACQSSKQSEGKESLLVDNLDPETRFTDIQVFGTHNSYHIAPDTDVVSEWNYTHDPLAIQLSRGCRQFELDVVWDPDNEEILVQHVPILDPGSQCFTLMDCLNDIRTWSHENQNHVPLQILIEPKTEIAAWAMTSHMDDLDQTLLGGLGDMIWSVDDQWGESSSLREAVIEEGWPTIGELKGKVVLVLLDTGEPWNSYTREGSEIRDRVMFPLVDSEHDWAAYFLRDDPYSEEIAALSETGFLIRTRAEAGLVFDQERWDIAYNGLSNAISMDTEEALSHLDSERPVRIIKE